MVPTRGVVWTGGLLVRVEQPSRLGPGRMRSGTEIWPSRQARAIIQLCFYSDRWPGFRVWCAVYARYAGGDAEPEDFGAALPRTFARREFAAAYRQSGPTYPDPVEHCGICDGRLFVEQWHKDDHLSLVAGITRNQRALVEREVNNVAQLARLASRRARLNV
jgi:uncharacterized protein